MTYKVPQWTAAVILVAGVIWISQAGSTLAFAVDEVVDNFVKAKSARYDMTVTVIGQPPQKMKAFYLSPSHFRQEFESGHVNIVDWETGKMVGLNPKTKRAMVFNLVNMPAAAREKMTTNQFDMVRQTLRSATTDPDAMVESLGEKQLDGHTVVGFRFRTGAQPMIVWADARTRYPVRIEATMVDPAAIASYFATYVKRQGIGKDEAPNAERMQGMMRIGRGFQFAVTLPADADAHYAGSGAKLGDADRAIFWYKPVDSTAYRVIPRASELRLR